jgi:hypothetical protein
VNDFDYSLSLKMGDAMCLHVTICLIWKIVVFLKVKYAVACKFIFCWLSHQFRFSHSVLKS